MKLKLTLSRFEAENLPNYQTVILARYHCPLQRIGKHFPRLAEFLAKYGLFTTVRVPKRFNVIGGHAFGECKFIRSIIVPDTVTGIHNAAFEECTRLENIRLPEGLESIPMNAFYQCSALKSITLPQSLKKIGQFSFGGTGLTAITFPAGLITIGRNAFERCTALEEVVLPESIRLVEEHAFYRCELKKLYVPDSQTGCGWAVVYGDGFRTDLLARLRTGCISFWEDARVWIPLLWHLMYRGPEEMRPQYKRTFMRHQAKAEKWIDQWLEDVISDTRFADMLADADTMRELLELSSRRRLHDVTAFLMEKNHRIGGEVSLEVTGDDLL